MSDPNQYYQERQRANLESKQSGNANRPTLEVVELEKQAIAGQSARWQQIVVYGLAVIGALALGYVILTAIF